MRILAALALVLMVVVPALPGHAAPLSPAARAKLDAGQSLNIIVEYEASQVDQSAMVERKRRGLLRDDTAVRSMRRQGYAALKSAVDNVARGADAAPLRDYGSLPMAVWRISSMSALKRLESQSNVRIIHEDIALHPNSVSDLAFINQPQAATQGNTGAGTVIAVVDGGLGSNYLNYSDFGACTAVNTPAATCRVLYNQDFYPGASSAVSHGTNVSAIALGVAPGAKLAMYNTFNGDSALTSDIISALNNIVANFSATTFNVAVVNLSLGDSSSHTTQCGSSNRFSSSYSAFNAPVNSLINLGIVTVAAAGNSGSKTGLSDPACVPGVVSVGAVYDGPYGSVSWSAPASCTDSSAADKVTCFSQSASYLTLLAPGSFVSAPNSSFQMSGTSQAAPHVSGSIAVLRARYPAEPKAQTVQRLTDTGVSDTDANAGNRVTKRIDLLGAANEATLMALTGQGPTQASAGNTASYLLTVTNSGPLVGTNVKVVNVLPGGATFVSASSGCSYSSGTVTCIAANLAVGAAVTFTINVQWTTTGPVYDLATLQADQYNSAATHQLAFGAPPSAYDVADAPLPAWSTAALAFIMMLMSAMVGARTSAANR